MNELPQASLLELFGSTTVTLTPQGILRSPVVMTIPEIWDPEGDEIYAEAPGVPPQHASALSVFLSSLVAMYFEGGAGDELCRAVRDKDVIEDTFTVVLRDACGATTEIPATVRIHVVDKVAPGLSFQPGTARWSATAKATLRNSLPGLRRRVEPGCSTTAAPSPGPTTIAPESS